MKAFDETFDEAARRLAKLIDVSVAENIGRHRKVAVAFSGGLDSSVLAFCAKRRAEVVACTAHARGSTDESRAKTAAGALGLQMLVSGLDEKSVSGELQAMDLPFQASLMDTSLWCLYSMVSRRAASAGAEVILLGQLADELFGGYAKYEKALLGAGEDAARAMMAEDVASYPLRGRIRDVAACSRWLEPRFPFESPEVVRIGSAIPASFKIRDGIRKAVLREAAKKLGVPPQVAEAGKKAAQYSSGMQKIVKELTLFNAPSLTPLDDSITST